MGSEGIAQDASEVTAPSGLHTHRASPPVFFLVALVAVVVVALVSPGPELSLPGGWLVAGACILAGIVLNVIASGQFERRNISIRPGSQSGCLETRGLYRFSRNPMYLGMVLVQVGAALALGSLVSFVVPAVFVGLLNRKFIRHEEALLRAEFGQEYADYSARVRRWI
jgi:protein-S-isoprenylcysteine O-methyltransferase Ste14